MILIFLSNMHDIRINIYYKKSISFINFTDIFGFYSTENSISTNFHRNIVSAQIRRLMKSDWRFLKISLCEFGNAKHGRGETNIRGKRCVEGSARSNCTSHPPPFLLSHRVVSFSAKLHRILQSNCTRMDGRTTRVHATPRANSRCSPWPFKPFIFPVTCIRINPIPGWRVERTAPLELTQFFRSWRIVRANNRLLAREWRTYRESMTLRIN